MSVRTPVPAGTNIASKLIGTDEYQHVILRDDAGADVLGLTTATPGAATVLGRLKTIADTLVTRLTPLATIAKQDATIAAISAAGTDRYTIATRVTLAANTATAWIDVPRGGYYFFDVTFTGSSPSLKLQQEGVGGIALDVVTRTTIGVGTAPVGILSGGRVRILNAGAEQLTAVSAVLA